jgi:hypothetical protein
MKKVFLVSTYLVIIFIMGSCGINYPLTLNQNQNSTQVHLARNNYKVIDKVSGSADATYVLIFGGMKKKQLYENAYSAMVAKANLTGASRALTNIVTEEQLGGVPPFYYKRTITVSAHVIEFTN